MLRRNKLMGYGQTSESRQNAIYKYKYGISLAEVKSKLQEQGNKCGICYKEFTEDMHTVVDHCHITGKFRGMLCRKCNVGIGMFGDDATTIERALQWLL